MVRPVKGFEWGGVHADRTHRTVQHGGVDIVRLDPAVPVDIHAPLRFFAQRAVVQDILSCTDPGGGVHDLENIGGINAAVIVHIAQRVPCRRC